MPLQKAQALDPAGDALNDQIDAATREHAIAQREQCYKIVTSALRSLKGDSPQREFGSPVRPAATRSSLDSASRKKYICQIVQLGVQSPDRLFHEYLYRTMIDLGLENELLEFGGPDLVPFLQSAGREPINEVFIISVVDFLILFKEMKLGKIILFLGKEDFKFRCCFLSQKEKEREREDCNYILN